MTRHDDVREKALADLQRYEVLMLNGHFDFGNGYHGAVYLNPHQLLRYPSTIYRFAQDLLDVIPPSILAQVEVVAGPVTGGALLGHTMAGLLDSRRDLASAPTMFAPFTPGSGREQTLSRFYEKQVRGRKVLLVDDVRNTGQTLVQCAELLHKSGARVLATATIYDRMEAVADAGVPHVSLAEYKAPDNYPAASCPLCHAGTPITAF